MTADTVGYLVLAAYVATVTAFALLYIRRAGEDWREGLLTFVFRGYTALVFGLRLRQRCPWPTRGPALIVANHRSPVDPLIVHSHSVFKRGGNQMRVVEWLTAREYCKQGGVVQWICDTARCIPVNRHGRDMAAVKDAIRRLRDGNIVGIFPEGRLNTGDSLLDFNTGVAFLAMSTDAPVYPIYIKDAPGGESMVEPFLTPTTSDVVYGEEFDMSPYRGQRPTPLILRELTARLRKAVADLGQICLTEPVERRPHAARGESAINGMTRTDHAPIDKIASEKKAADKPQSDRTLQKTAI